MNRQTGRLAKILRDIQDYNELEMEFNPENPVQVFPWIVRGDAGALAVRKGTDGADPVQRSAMLISASASTEIQGAKSPPRSFQSIASREWDRLHCSSPIGRGC